MASQLLKDLSEGNFEAVERALIKAPNRLVETRNTLIHSRIRALILDPNVDPGAIEYLIPVGTNRAITSLFTEVDRLVELFEVALGLAPTNRIYSVPPLFLLMDSMIETSRELRASMSEMLPRLLDYVQRADTEYAKLGFVYLISQLFVRGVISTQQDFRPLADYIRQDLQVCGDYYVTLLYARVIIHLRPFHLETLDPDSLQLRSLANLTQLNFGNEGPKAICELADSTPIGEQYFRLRHIQFSHGRVIYAEANKDHDLGGGVLVCGRLSLCLVIGPTVILRLYYDSVTRIQISYRRALMLLTFPFTLLPRLSAIRDWGKPTSPSRLTHQSQEVVIELKVEDSSTLVAFRDDAAPIIAQCRALILYSASQSLDDVVGVGSGPNMNPATATALQSQTFQSFDASSRISLNESSYERKTRRAAIYVLPIRYSVTEPPMKADVPPLSPEAFSPELLRSQGGLKAAHPFSSASVPCTPKDLLRASSSIDIMELKAKHRAELTEFRASRGAHLEELMCQLRSDEEAFKAICSDFREELTLGYEIFREMWEQVNSAILEFKRDLVALQQRQHQELNQAPESISGASLDRKRARLLELRSSRRPLSRA
ncbi:hypothetical protein GMRT_14378 [Giardia muris]|uniref:Uncharacterized protein n=1 Tax=Giardia muris TaxID=5742 RepID=A0A4Z1SQV1_GIAMU|nr:hypothetical protein GMRT_14378 [Giardia muris]|eukprot:TNJ28226.1 hypothetical protein GMRT_14378 [Giardia muris]